MALTPSTRTPDDVLRQVVALLSKTVAQGATPEEAAAAAAKAQSLMFAYNLTTADVSKSRRGTVRITEAGMPLRTDTYRGEYPWQYDLLVAVCKFNFTMILDTKRVWNPKAVAGRGAWVTSDVQVLGTKPNLAATEYLYAYLYREVMRLAKATRKHALAEARERWAHSSWRRTDGEVGIPTDIVWERSFGEGAVASIAEQLRIQRATDMADARPEDGALIVTLDREVEEAWYQRKYGKSKAQVVAAREAQDRKWQAERDAQRKAEAELQAKYLSGELQRPVVAPPSNRKVPKPRRSYSSGPREIYDYRATEAGLEAGKRIPVRPAVDADDEEAQRLLGTG